MYLEVRRDYRNFLLSGEHEKIVTFYNQQIWDFHTIFFVAGRNEENRGEDSDYYTPEEPNPSSVYDRNIPISSVESTPQKNSGTSYSQLSTRSSGDSYSSGNSTKRLLTVVVSDEQTENAVHI